jgi:protein TonB
MSGIVFLEAIIAKDGSVKDLRVTRSAGVLDQAAIDAVSQWRYTPTLLNGEPVEVIMTVTVNFTFN